MKITITFEQKEKETMMSMALNCGGVKEVVDKDEHVVGNFGEFKYNHEENEMVLDLKPAFIKASAMLTVSVINMIKSFISTCEMFNESWFSDTKNLLAEETKKEKESEPVGYTQASQSDFKKAVEEELKNN